jgi:hypothetical protein
MVLLTFYVRLQEPVHIVSSLHRENDATETLNRMTIPNFEVNEHLTKVHKVTHEVLAHPKLTQRQKAC